MLSGVGTLSAFSKAVLVNLKIVFKSLGACISFRGTWFIQGNAVGKIKSSFLNFKLSYLLDLFLKLYNLDKLISSSLSSFLNLLIISAVGCECPISQRSLTNDLFALKYKSDIIKIDGVCVLFTI